VDASRPTQVERALQELGIKMIPAYSPQARGRMEQSYHVDTKYIRKSDAKGN
jgi:hypothetical protein